VEVVNEKLQPIQERFQDIRNSDELMKILKQGQEQAQVIAQQTMRDVKEKLGFVQL